MSSVALQSSVKCRPPLRHRAASRHVAADGDTLVLLVEYASNNTSFLLTLNDFSNSVTHFIFHYSLLVVPQDQTNIDGKISVLFNFLSRTKILKNHFTHLETIRLSFHYALGSSVTVPFGMNLSGAHYTPFLKGFLFSGGFIPFRTREQLKSLF